MSFMAAGIAGLASAIGSGIGKKMMGDDKSPSTPTAGIESAVTGPNPNDSHQVVPVEATGSQANDLIMDTAKRVLTGGITSTSDALTQMIGAKLGIGPKSAAAQGRDARSYLANAFPELNAWERAGAGGSMSGSAASGQDNELKIAKMNMANQKEMAQMQNDTAIKIAGINSQTSRLNTKDQVYAQNEMLDANKSKVLQEVSAIAEQSNLSREQQASQIVQRLLMAAQANGANVSAEQAKALTQKIYAEIPNIQQQGQNLRYGTSQIGATAKDVTNMMTGAGAQISNLYDEFVSGVSSAVQSAKDWYDKSGGITGPASRKEPTRRPSGKGGAW